MITIDVTENGYIRIDATDESARRTDLVPYQNWTSVRIQSIAQAITPEGHTIRAMSFRTKKGLSNRGWTAVYLDVTRNEDYIMHSRLAHERANAARDEVESLYTDLGGEA